MLKTDTKEHYKMYKSGKQMVNAMLLSALIATGGLALNQTAKADTTENPVNQPVVQTTVNSAAQATSQAVANSAVSAVASASQVSSASSSVSSAAPVAQTSQPASTAAVNTFNVSRNSTPVTNVTQNLVQTNQTVVQNIQATLTSSTDKDASAIEFHPGQDSSLAKAFDLSLDFDIDASNIKADRSYLIGDISSTFENNGHYMPIWNNEAQIPFFINNQKYGEITFNSNDDLRSQSVYVHFDLNQSDNMTGLQHISVNMPGVIIAGYNLSPLIIANQQNTIIDDHLRFTTLTGTILADKILHIYKPVMSHKTTPVHYNQAGFGSTGSSHSNLINNLTPTFNNEDDINKLIKGEAVNIYDLPSVIEIGGQIKADGNNILPQHTYVHKDLYIPVFHSDGSLSNEQVDVSPWKGSDEQPKSPAVNLGDNLTLSQMKALNYIGFGYSLQADHSYLYLIKQPSADLTINENELKDKVQSLSWQLAADPDPAKALQITFDKFNQGLKIYQFQTDVSIADPTAPVKLTITRLYSNYLSNSNQNLTANTVTVPSSSMASGQSAVKLHVINATNGADLKHSIHFVISLIY